MKNILKYGLGFLLMATLPASFIACSDDDEFAELPAASYPASVEMILPTDVQPLLYKDEQGAVTLPLVKGEKVALGFSIAPDDVTFKDGNGAVPMRMLLQWMPMVWLPGW